MPGWEPSGAFWRPWTGTLLLAAPLILVVLLTADAESLSTQRVATSFFINTMLAVGIQTFIGLSGFISLGHVAFMAIGAYSAAILVTPTAIKAYAIPAAPMLLVNTSLDFLTATLVAAAIGASVGLLIGVVIVRLSFGAAPVATLSFMIIVWVINSNFTTLTRGDQTFYGIPRDTSVTSAAIGCIVVLLLARLLRDSRVGLALRSSREDDLAARASGVNVAGVRLAAWVASAAMVAAGGAFYAQQVGAINPKLFLFDKTFLLIAMIIVGGRSISGAVVGVAMVTIIVEVLRRVENTVTIDGHDLFGITNFGLGLAIVLTMMLRKDGVLGRWEVDELLARRARRS